MTTLLGHRWTDWDSLEGLFGGAVVGGRAKQVLVAHRGLGASFVALLLFKTDREGEEEGVISFCATTILSGPSSRQYETRPFLHGPNVNPLLSSPSFSSLSLPSPISPARLMISSSTDHNRQCKETCPLYSLPFTLHEVNVAPVRGLPFHVHPPVT